MVTLNKAAGLKGAPQRLANEPARLEAQQSWAKEQLTDKDGKLIRDKVVVVPLFEKKGKNWVPGTEVIRATRNPMFGSILIMGVAGEASNNISSLRWGGGSNNLVTALEMGNVEYLADFEGGQLLDGRIDTAYQTFPTNLNDMDQDRHFINATARELNIPAVDEDGTVIYSVRFWQEDMAAVKPAMPKIGNMEEIQMQVAATKAKLLNK